MKNNNNKIANLWSFFSDTTITLSWDKSLPFSLNRKKMKQSNNKKDDDEDEADDVN